MRMSIGLMSAARMTIPFSPLRMLLTTSLTPRLRWRVFEAFLTSLRVCFAVFFCASGFAIALSVSGEASAAPAASSASGLSFLLFLALEGVSAAAGAAGASIAMASGAATASSAVRLLLLPMLVVKCLRTGHYRVSQAHSS